MPKIPKIYGFNKSSEAGPDEFSPSIFLGACNFRCAYCMNKKAVLDFSELKEIPISVVQEFIKEAGSEWINISGGEVTLYPADQLRELFLEFKSVGCKIAISTNGFQPSKLLDLISHIHYVTMDIKTDHQKYNELVHNPLKKRYSAMYDVMNSLFLLRYKKSKDVTFDYEVRTTMYRPLVGEAEVREIGSLLKTDERWMLQPFRQAKNMIGEEAYSVEPYSKEEMNNLLSVAKEYSSKAFIRYV